MLPAGSKLEKVVEALTSIGPAVFNGGLTTFLALVLLGGSTSHVFVTFFKVWLFSSSVSVFIIFLQVFVLTVCFGLFHGLVLFPVLLSLVGPSDGHPSAAHDQSEAPTGHCNSTFAAPESDRFMEKMIEANFNQPYRVSDKND